MSDIQLFDSTQKRIKDRVNDAFLGTFTLSFCVYNWKFFYFLTFAKSQNDQSLHSIIEQSSNAYLTIYSVVYPLVVTLFYLFVYPTIKAKILSYHLKKEKDLKNIANKIEKEILLTKTEMNLERDKMNKDFNNKMLEMENHKGNAEALRNYIPHYLNRVYNNNRTYIYTIANSSILDEGKCYLLENQSLVKITELRKDDRIVYAFEKIYNDNILAARVGALIPIPAQFERDQVTQLFIDKYGITNIHETPDYWISIYKEGAHAARIDWGPGAIS